MDIAVFDVETTGFRARDNSIVEIAIKRFSSTGILLGEYESLVNPFRDVGPEEVHKLTKWHVRDAPSFETIAGDIIEMFRGAIMVAHNVRFDHSFLKEEMTRANLKMGLVPRLCTLELSRDAFPHLRKHSLAQVCKAAHISNDDPHTAMGDVNATAELYFQIIQILPDVEDYLRGRKGGKWPQKAPSGLSLRRDQVKTPSLWEWFKNLFAA